MAHFCMDIQDDEEASVHLIITAQKTQKYFKEVYSHTMIT
jgi:hypothetical protein